MRRPGTAPDNVFLVGPMGAGKSAVGRALARELGWTFHDSDDEVRARTGADVELIFDMEGEDGFRKRERIAIAELTAGRRIVLATGGGSVLDPANRADLAARGLVVYLHATPEQQLVRARPGHGRPLLNAADPQARIAELFSVRDPLYREIADVIVPTDGKRVTSVVRQLLEEIEWNR